MRLLHVVMVGAILLGGCASSPLSKVQNLSQKNLGEVSEIVFGWKARASDESEKLRHWKLEWGFYVPDHEKARLAIDMKLGQYAEYCSVLGGTLSEPTAPQQFNGAWQIVREVTCKANKTNAAIFRILAGYDGVPQRMSREPRRGACVWPAGTDRLDCTVWIDAFQWKSPGVPEDMDGGYKLGALGFGSIQAVNVWLLKQREENDMRTKEMMAEVERKMQQQKEEEQRLRERYVSDLPKVKIVGQKICRAAEITQRKVRGYAMGAPVYADPIKAQAKVTGFTESSLNSKIQVRISGIQANGENLNRIDGDVVLENGAIIWDEATNWGLCY